MIRKCLWRGRPISCAAIFKMQATDKGMCCSFNKDKADLMFKESRYLSATQNMNSQDKMWAVEKSNVPEW